MKGLVAFGQKLNSSKRISFNSLAWIAFISTKNQPYAYHDQKIERKPRNQIQNLK